MKRRTSTPSKRTPSKRSKEVFLADKIVDARKSANGLEYLVSWEGYPRASDNTWEPAGNILDTKLISDFEAAQKSSRAIEESVTPKNLLTPKSKAAKSTRKPIVSETLAAVTNSQTKTATTMPRTSAIRRRIVTPAAACFANSITPRASVLVVPDAETHAQPLISPSIMLVLISAAIGAVFMTCVSTGLEYFWV